MTGLLRAGQRARPAGGTGRRDPRSARCRAPDGGRAGRRQPAIRDARRGGRRARPPAARGSAARRPARRQGAVARPSSGSGSDTCWVATPASCRSASASSCSIALAVAQAAPILVLDEPTVHLDLRHQVGAMELLVDLNERDGTTDHRGPPRPGARRAFLPAPDPARRRADRRRRLGRERPDAGRDPGGLRRGPVVRPAAGG